MSDHSSHDEVSEASRAAGHEVSDADASPLVKAGIALAAIMLVGFIGMLFMFRTLTYARPFYDAAVDPHPLSATRTVVTGPRLQPDPPREKAELRKFEDNLLTTYEWIDQEGRIARIPVDRAIEVVASTGLPESGSAAAASGSAH